MAPSDARTQLEQELALINSFSPLQFLRRKLVACHCYPDGCPECAFTGALEAQVMDYAALADSPYAFLVKAFRYDRSGRVVGVDFVDKDKARAERIAAAGLNKVTIQQSAAFGDDMDPEEANAALARLRRMLDDE